MRNTYKYYLNLSFNSPLQLKQNSHGLHQHFLNKKRFELSNHLSNVLTTISDYKKPNDINADALVDFYNPQVISAQDYYPFGAPMKERTFSSAGYRYGFNGKENDNEVKGQGNQQDYGMRIYDPRLARFLSVDPLTKSYPWYTPYQFAGNKPIWAIDLDGAEEYYTTNGALIGKIGKSTSIRVVDDKNIKAVKNYIVWNNRTEIVLNKIYSNAKANDLSIDVNLKSNDLKELEPLANRKDEILNESSKLISEVGTIKAKINKLESDFNEISESLSDAAEGDAAGDGATFSIIFERLRTNKAQNKLLEEKLPKENKLAENKLVLKFLDAKKPIITEPDPKNSKEVKQDKVINIPRKLD